ncbi:hypothetical protein SteCoe_11729 [Stentor coeruleus]|uniref:TmcB/TmcC TPR repeats domain-containing protein n=1 Tax=Stentor coeruleus TaxID=5963 RepID=A0A1R2CCI7_9CILI|nr:hypothetical protein SteCoe_11729 [Stentor coeruleus]
MKAENLYKNLSLVFKGENTFILSSRTQKVIMVIKSFQIISQQINFLWAPQMDMKYWDSTSKFWFMISLASIDNLAAELSFLFWLLMLVMCLISAAVIMIAGIIIAENRERKIPTWVKKTLKIILFLVCDCYFIPCSNILFLLSKYSYSNTPYAYISEYLSYPNISYLDLGLPGKVVSVLFLAFLLILGLSKEIFTLETRYSLANIDLSAKSQAELGIQIKIISFIICGLWVYNQTDSYSILLAFLVASYGFLSIKTIFVQTYYSNYMNFMDNLVFFESFAVGLFFVVGFFIKNAYTVVILTVFLQPGIFGLSYSSIFYRKKLLKSPKNEVFGVSFELASRKWYGNQNKAKKMIKYFNLNYQTYHNKMTLVLLANYCADVLNNTLVASIKICQVDFQGINLSSNFQVYLLQEKLKLFNIQTSESLKLCAFLKKYKQAIFEEKSFCLLYEKMLKNLSKNEIDLISLRQHITYFNYSLKQVIRNYETIIEKFPNSRIINKVFASFLGEIANRPDLASAYINKIKLNTIKKRENEVSMDFFSDPNAYVMIISGGKKQIGKILYGSPNICKYLDVHEDEITDHWLYEFIPKVYAGMHKKSLEVFVRESLTQIVLKSVKLVLCSLKGFLVESFVYAECVGFDSEVDFVIVVEPVNNNKDEIALIDNNSCILQHSAKFPLALGISTYKIDNTFLSNYIPKREYSLLNKNNLLLFSKSPLKNRNSKILLVRESIQVFSTTINIVKIVLDNSEKLKKIKELIPSLCESDLNSITEGTTSTFRIKQKCLAEENFFESICNRSLTEKNRRYTRSSNYSVSVISNNKLMRDIDRDFKIVKLFFWLTVIGMVLFNLVTSVYIYNQAKSLAKLDSFTHVADIYTSFAFLGFYMRSADTNLYYKKPFSILIENITEINTFLKLSHEQLNADRSKWLMCPSSKIMTSNIIPIWIYSETPEKSSTNLMDLIDNTITHSSLIYKQLSNNLTEQYTENLYFLLFNTFRASLSTLKNTFDDMIDCVDKQNKDIWIFSLQLLAICSIIYGVFLIGLNISLIFFKKKEVVLWEFLSTQIQDNYSVLSAAVKNRLINFHKDFQEKQPKESEIIKKRVKFRRSWRYFIAILGLVLLSLGYITAYINWFFYKNIELLQFRMNVFEIMVNRRVKLAQSVFYAEEIFMETYNYDFGHRFFNYTLMPNASIGLAHINEEMKEISKVTLTETFRENLPKEIFDIMYKEYNSSFPILKKGIWNAFSVFRRNTLYLTGNKKNISYEFLDKYINEAFAILGSFVNIIPITDKAVLEDINNNIMVCVIFSVIWSILEVTYGVFVYKKLFEHDKNAIRSVMTMLKLIPSDLITLKSTLNR